MILNGSNKIERLSTCVVETHVWTALQRVKIYEPRAPETSPPFNAFPALQHRSLEQTKNCPSSSLHIYSTSKLILTLRLFSSMDKNNRTLILKFPLKDVYYNRTTRFG